VARLTYREKLARVEKLLTQTPTPAQRKVILRRLAEEVAKDAPKLTRAKNRVKRAPSRRSVNKQPVSDRRVFLNDDDIRVV
jgi:hypothetical protein